MILKVNIWDNLVGSIYWDENQKIASFEYDSSFVSKGLELAPFLMPLKVGTVYEFKNLNYDTFNGLPPMMVDSLPDDFGNFIMNAWLGKQGLTIENLLPTERLGYIGKRGMGALEYEPVLDKSTEFTSQVNVDELVDIANQVFYSKKENSYNGIDSDSLTKILRIGTSAGGARAKAILALDENNKVYKAGDLLHGPGHSYWIIKLDGVSDKLLGDPQGFGKIEYAYYKMALDAGIEMSECKLLIENNRAHFLTRRFDRNAEGEKVHMQTLGGLTGMDYKQANVYSYEQVFTVLRRMMLPHSAIEQQFRRMAFNVIARNQDDHVKNISFLMDKTGKWSLAPAYDITYNHNPNGVWTSKHQLSINGKRDDFTIEDLLLTGKENNIRSRNTIVDQILEVVSHWKGYASDIGIDKKIINAISNSHRLKLANFK
jgi:serine/threonine-protein kinase HipA